MLKDSKQSKDYKQELAGLLRTLFQLDDSDYLDFGIYRIMNQKRTEIEQFINKDLFDAVDAEFDKYSESDQTELINEVGRRQTALNNSTISDQHKSAIFSYIYHFFKRYYTDGDFISQRRYSKKEKYAIPYNGEEVVLYWVNNDQYYIKTGEYFKNFTFKEGEYTINFRILDAESTMNNNKAEKRYFVLKSSEKNMDYDPHSKTLTIFFEYRGLSKNEEKRYGKKNVQNDINEKTVEAVLSGIRNPGLKTALNGTKNDEAVLEKQLNTYTKKNTSDFFIHKNLKGFLTRELDFYIKNEVFHLDDLGTENEVSIEQYVARAKVIKSICLEIIDFLAQIEDFQKELFEKKKFVIRTDYCMTLDNVPEKLCSEILRNERQLNEWKTLYGIENEGGSTLASFDEIYLKEHPYLVLDTKFFNWKFKDELLASFDDLDEVICGLMVNSENCQALNLIQEKYKERVKCIYIDPPYNTGGDGFLYKDKYRHSSWLTMMENRLRLAKELLDPYGFLFSSIDENEIDHLTKLFDTLFPERVGIVVVQNNPKGRGQDRHLATSHEYIVSVAKNEEARLIGIPKTDKQLSDYPQKDEIGEFRFHELRNTHRQFNRETRPNLWYPLYIDEKSGSVTLEQYEKTEVVYPIWNDGFEGCWTWGRELVANQIHLLVGRLVSGKWKIYRKDYAFQNGKVATFMPKTIWAEKGMRTDIGQQILDNVMGYRIFRSPKPHELIIRAIELTSNSTDYILDFFSGSGTTAHAVLNLNKEDSGNRKYIMVEMADYFDSVMKPRIQKVMYSSNWKDGKPQSNDGISHIFKYLVLEQYEDTLNNIEFNGAGGVQSTLLELDGYFLRYMLDFETRDSTCRLNVEKMSNPFSYTLKITKRNEMKEETVDLVETFNYLLGIHVRQIKAFNNNGTYYRVVHGKKDEDDFTIIWRNTEEIDLKKDKAFIEGTILNGSEPSKTYINADFFVEGACPIEPEFKKLMGA